MTNKGQAMIEALFVGSIFIVALFFFIRYAMIIQQFLLVDEFIEQALICLTEDRPTCVNRLRRQLGDLHFSDVSVRQLNAGHVPALAVAATSSFGRRFEKESELQLDLHVSP